MRIEGRVTLQASNSDVNGDGLMDKVVHIDTQVSNLTKNAVEVCLTGVHSEIRILPPPRRGKERVGVARIENFKTFLL